MHSSAPARRRDRCSGRGSISLHLPARGGWLRTGQSQAARRRGEGSNPTPSADTRWFWMPPPDAYSAPRLSSVGGLGRTHLPAHTRLAADRAEGVPWRKSWSDAPDNLLSTEERWPSGRRRSPAKRVGGVEPPRGFKSLPLRKRSPAVPRGFVRSQPVDSRIERRPADFRRARRSPVPRRPGSCLS